ncbi:MAG: mannosyltransferase family protein [Marmoricola sp.]
MRRWWALPLGIFALSRVEQSLLFGYLLRKQHDSYIGPGGGLRSWGHPVTFLDGLLNWDGVWYRQIAERGYPQHLPMLHGHVRENALAFYPLFPGIVRAVMGVGLSFELAAFLVSLVCGAIASCVLFKLVLDHASRFTAAMAVLGLMFAPMAVIFEAAYTESLALLLLLLALTALGRRRYGWFAFLTLLIALARPMSLPLALVCGVVWIVRWRQRGAEPFELRERLALGAAAVWAAFTFALWPAIVGLRTGVLTAYFKTQNAWAHGSGEHGWRSWIQQALHFQHPLMSVSVVAGAVVVIAAMVLHKGARAWGLELRTWTWAYPLYILGTARPTTSIFRYLMLTVTPLWPAPGLSERAQSLRARAGLVALVLIIGLVGQVLWINAYFVIWHGDLGAA